MFRQLVVNGLIYGLGFYATLVAELDSISHAAFKLILTGYGFWNLYYFHHLIRHILCEPITRSQKLQPILHNFDARHLYLN